MKKLASAALVIVLMAGSLMLFNLSAGAGESDAKMEIPDAVGRALERSPIMEIAEVRRDKARLEWKQAQDTADWIEDVLGDADAASLYERQARSSYRIADAEMDATEEDLTLQVKLAYRSVEIMQVLRRPTRAAVRVAREAVRTAQEMFEEDLINRAELLQAQQQLQATIGIADEVLAQQEKAERALKQLLDYDENDQLQLAEAPPRFRVLKVDSIDEKVERALEDRFETTEIEEMINLAEYRLRVVRRSDFDPGAPEFTWIADIIGFDSDAGGDSGYAEDIAELELREAQLGKRMIKGQIETQVRNLYRDIRTKEQKVRQKQAAEALAQENYRRTMHKHQEDMATRLELLSARVERLQAEAELVVAQYEHQMLIMRFHHSYGTGSSVDADFDPGGRGNDGF